MTHLEAGLAHHRQGPDLGGVRVSPEPRHGLSRGQERRGGRVLRGLVVAQQLGSGSVAAFACVRQTWVKTGKTMLTVVWLVDSQI